MSAAFVLPRRRLYRESAPFGGALTGAFDHHARPKEARARALKTCFREMNIQPDRLLFYAVITFIHESRVNDPACEMLVSRCFSVMVFFFFF